MTNITILGIDLAKNVFELCGLGTAGEVVYTRTVKHKDFFRLVCQLDVKAVAMEACGSAQCVRKRHIYLVSESLTWEGGVSPTQ